MNYGQKNYKQMQITTASPGQVLIMLYEGAILNVKKATIAIREKNLSDKGKYIGKAHDIINELNNTLNHEVGGNVSKDLENLYNFMITQLLKANLDQNAECLIGVQKNLETLLEGWKVAVATLQKEAATKGSGK